MTTATIRAIDRASAALGGASDYRLAKLLGVRQQTLSKYRTGGSQLDDAVAVRLAEMLHEPAAQLLAEIAAERTKDDTARKHWLRLAKLARAACLVMALAVSFTATQKLQRTDADSPAADVAVDGVELDALNIM